MAADTFYWHDYETFGANPRLDRPAQFAGVRTDLNLKEVEPPLVIYCRPSTDYLPHPEACLITGITPQKAAADGLPEPEFCADIHETLSEPGTCALGYNSIRFDDEVTRHLLFRNFYDPYQREYAHHNSRWDLIDVVRLCYALRPEGIQWPSRDDGQPSFRLEHIAEANRLSNGKAHDALNDVRTTIALARLIKKHQPRLFRYAYDHRRRPACESMLDYVNAKPILHISARYPASRGCLAMVLPLCPHPTNQRAVIVYDLSVDPGPLLELDRDAIQDRLFTPTADLPEGEQRIPLKSVSTNHAPVLVPLSVLKSADHNRIQMDTELCRSHRDQIVSSGINLTEKIQEVFNTPPPPLPEDPEQSLYGGGFASAKDKALMIKIRRLSPPELANIQERFEDPRYRHLMFRYRARHYSDTLGPDESERWLSIRREKLLAGQPSRLEEIEAALERQRKLTPDDGDRLSILDQVEAFVREIQDELLAG